MAEEEKVKEMQAEENETNILIMNNGEDDITCEVIATVSLENGNYLLVHPRDIPEVGDDEAIVFEVKDNEGETLYYYVEDSDVIEAVFAEYYRLFDEN